MKNSLFKLWYKSRYWLTGNDNLMNILDITKIKKIFSIPHRILIERILTNRYGSSIKESQIGNISVQGINIKLYDPRFSYLYGAAMGIEYEPSVTHYLKTIIDDKRICFLDIGAHIGYYTSYVGNLNKKCEIYSFEPNKQFFNELTKNIQMNNINAIPYNIALSDKTGVILFHDRSIKVEKKDDYEIINSTTFDKLRDEECIYPDIVKIDVHGAEGNVLYGMKKALRNDISHVFCEIHTDSQLAKYTTKEVLDILIKSGFELYEIDRFREYTKPNFIEITDSLYNEFINEKKWADYHMRNERMIYATKESLF